MMSKPITIWLIGDPVRGSYLSSAQELPTMIIDIHTRIGRRGHDQSGRAEVKLANFIGETGQTSVDDVRKVPWFRQALSEFDCGIKHRLTVLDKRGSEFVNRRDAATHVEGPLRSPENDAPTESRCRFV